MNIKNHPRNKQFVEQSKIYKFKDLPTTAQDALIHYMSVDGAAWAVADKWPDWIWGEGKPSKPEQRKQVLNDIEKFKPRFIKEYGEYQFGYSIVNWKDLLNAVNGDEVLVNEGRKFEYGHAGTKEYDIPTWPVILSEFEDETLQDGWHRFALYCKLELDIPVVFYAY